jgi:MFS family permease
MQAFVLKHLRFNWIVNLLDGGFFGLALGFASFSTVIPLFVSTMTDSAILIGLIPAIHSVGWQLPQLFMAERVGKLRRTKPMVIRMTIHERLPFLGMGVTALLLPVLGKSAALPLIYMMLIWQGMGGGFTANAWQVMISKIIPTERHATFYGFQSSMANLLMSGSAVGAGFLLDKLQYPYNYALCFFLAGGAMLFSLWFLAATREPDSPPVIEHDAKGAVWTTLKKILKTDRNFRGFLGVRMLSQLSVMGFSFYIVYAKYNLGMNEAVAGLLTGVLTVGQIIYNPLMGWIGDKTSHASVMKIGALAAGGSALIAWWAPTLGWFVLVFILMGVANVALWTIGLAMLLQFGNEGERPVYIGLANTLVAPFTIVAPIIGGWLADTYSYPVAFMVSAVCALATVLVLQFFLKDPRHLA